MTAVAKLPDAIRALAEVIRKHGTCAPAALDHVADELTAALSARASAGEGGAGWPNGSDKTVPAALRYLAEHERPIGGEQRYNSAHLYQLADEVERMASRLLTAAPQPAQAGASGGGDEHPYRQLQKWWEDGEPIPTLTIPDWAIASAYRQAVSKIVGPYFRAPNALPWAADITVAADWAAQEWRKKHPDYALDPLALAEWIRIHHRCSEVKDWERLPPELLWIYESLQRLAKLESTPATPATGDAATWEEEIRRHDATPPAHGDGEGDDPFGDMPAPIGNPEAWPPNYADGYNDAVRNMVDSFPSVRARLTARPTPEAQEARDAQLPPGHRWLDPEIDMLTSEEAARLPR